MRLPFVISFDRSGFSIEWGGPERDWYYWMIYLNWHKKQRMYGFYRTWYDGPHAALHMWGFVISWSTHWTVPPLEFRKKKK